MKALFTTPQPMKALFAIGMLAALVSPALAFPPAPYYTIYGIVRDQVGQKLDVDGAEIILLSGTRELGRAPITRGELDQNYELSIRIDTIRTGTAVYSDKAIAAEGAYSVAVDMNGVRFYPIEASGGLTAGKGSERVRLDLNLGEDKNGEGLPDVWENWQLYQAGDLPDANGNWPINLLGGRDGDFDHDGISNWMEYLAGTFAGDASERFELKIKEKLATSVRFEFYGITGKTYALERLTNLGAWARIPFSVGTPGPGAESFQATGVGILSAYATAAGTKEIYRLSVR